MKKQTKRHGGLGNWNKKATYFCVKCGFSCRHKTLIKNHKCPAL